MPGAFCIFGISRSLCLAQAEKKTPTRRKVGDHVRELTIEEWAADRDKMAAKLFGEKKKAVKVSPTFENPHGCASWLAADRANVRDAVLMVRAPKLDSQGEPVIEKGVVKMTWRKYEEECERIRIKPAEVSLTP